MKSNIWTKIKIPKTKVKIPESKVKIPQTTIFGIIAIAFDGSSLTNQEINRMEVQPPTPPRKQGLVTVVDNRGSAGPLDSHYLPLGATSEAYSCDTWQPRK